MSSYYNPKIGARGGNACHPRRPFSKNEIERMERYYNRNEDSNMVQIQGGRPILFSRRRLKVNGKLFRVPKNKDIRIAFVALIKSGLSWDKSLAILSRL